MISNNVVTHEEQLCAESDCQTLPYIPVSKSNPAEKRSKHRKKKQNNLSHFSPFGALTLARLTFYIHKRTVRC